MDHAGAVGVLQGLGDLDEDVDQLPKTVALDGVGVADLQELKDLTEGGVGHQLHRVKPRRPECRAHAWMMLGCSNRR